MSIVKVIDNVTKINGMAVSDGANCILDINALDFSAIPINTSANFANMCYYADLLKYSNCI